MKTGFIFNIQRFSVHDGPGIRTTVFLKGCPLRCWWCHNPESQSPRAELLIQENFCLVCGTCAQVCPHCEADLDAPEPAPTDNQRCTLCGDCVDACPSDARKMIGTAMTGAELENEILADRVFFDESGGGVTFSGGEPLSQAAFLRESLHTCRKHEIHTAVDTCGHVARKDLLAVAPLTDLFLYDLKIMDSLLHEEVTGVPNSVILDNLRALEEIHDNIWIRVPVIPGVNDTIGNMEATADFASASAAIRRISLLPYHYTGVQKFHRTGKEYMLDGLEAPPAEKLERLAECFRSRNLETVIGG